MARSYDLEFRLDRAKEIVRALHSKRWTRSSLASKTGYDEKTIRNLLAGNEVRDQTIVDVCQALDIEPRLHNDIENVDCADDLYGGYLRSTHHEYEGFYYMYKRSFSTENAIFRAVIEIRWDDADERFNFSQYYQPSQGLAPFGAKSRVGAVYISARTNLVHLMSIHHGSIDLIVTVTKMRQDMMMRGIISLPFEDITFTPPATSPVLLKKINDYEPESSLAPDIRVLRHDDADLSFAQEQLSLTERQVVRVRFEAPR